MLLPNSEKFHLKHQQKINQLPSCTSFNPGYPDSDKFYFLKRTTESHGTQRKTTSCKSLNLGNSDHDLKIICVHLHLIFDI